MLERAHARESRQLRGVEKFVREAVGEDLHAKRVLSLANATLGALHAAALGVTTIGNALAVGAKPRPEGCGEAGGPASLELRGCEVIPGPSLTADSLPWLHLRDERAGRETDG